MRANMHLHSSSPCSDLLFWRLNPLDLSLKLYAALLRACCCICEHCSKKRRKGAFLPIFLIADQSRTPGKTAAEAFQQQHVTALDAPGADALIKGQRHRSGRGIALLVQGHNHL